MPKFVQTLQVATISFHADMQTDIHMSHKTGAIGELGYLAKRGKMERGKKLLQIMCFQFQVLEFCT
jgi:hypothetical protein